MSRTQRPALPLTVPADSRGCPCERANSTLSAKHPASTASTHGRQGRISSRKEETVYHGGANKNGLANKTQQYHSRSEAMVRAVTVRESWGRVGRWPPKTPLWSGVKTQRPGPEAGKAASGEQDWRMPGPGTAAGLRGGQQHKSGGPGHRPAAQNRLIFGTGDDKQGQEKREIMISELSMKRGGKI